MPQLSLQLPEATAKGGKLRLLEVQGLELTLKVGGVEELAVGGVPSSLLTLFLALLRVGWVLAE